MKQKVDLTNGLPKYEYCFLRLLRFASRTLTRLTNFNQAIGY
jgi:hypothetical protein